MKKTIFKANEEVSIMILSSIAIFFTFFLEYIGSYNVLSRIVFIIKSLVACASMIFIYKLEKTEGIFKYVAGVFASLFFINFILTIPLVVFVNVKMIFNIVKFVFDLLHLLALIISMLFFVESLFKYSYVESKLYSNIMSIVRRITSFISYPTLKIINKKIVNKRVKF